MTQWTHVLKKTVLPLKVDNSCHATPVDRPQSRLLKNEIAVSELAGTIQLIHSACSTGPHQLLIAVLCPTGSNLFHHSWKALRLWAKLNLSSNGFSRAFCHSHSDLLYTVAQSMSTNARLHLFFRVLYTDFLLTLISDTLGDIINQNK